MSVAHNPPTLTRPLGLGSNGDEVRALQMLLNQAGLGCVLTADGRFGKRTHVALMAFQRKKGLKADGVVGPSTARALGWNCRAMDARPYVIRYDKPPLPAMTPPFTAVAEGIRVGMGAFKELMFDGITKAYARTNYGVPTPTDVHQKQFHQVKTRLADLEWHFDKIWSSLRQLQDQVAAGGEPNLVGLRGAFAYFATDMRSSLRAMDLLSADTRACEQALDRLPYQHVIAIVERFLRGEQTAAVAMVQVQLAFENANRDFAANLQRQG